MRVNTRFQNTPGINLLTDDQCEEIYLAALEVLERVGVMVYNEEALTLLKEAGARVKRNHVILPSYLVKKALSTAPSRIAIGNRNGERAMFLEKGRVYFGSGSDTQYTMDIGTGERRLVVKQDVVNAARVIDALKNIDFAMSLGIISDVPPRSAYIHQFEALLLNTAKPIVYTAGGREDVETILAMAEVAAGSKEKLEDNPFLICYAEPTSPLVHPREAVEKLLFCSQRRMPVMYVPALMLGATGPVTMAGALVVTNAETLTGLVIHQLKNPGAPFIAGGAAPALDMGTSLCSYGSPEEHLSCAFNAAMARFYNLPSFSTAGCSDSHLFDQQAGMEAGYSILMQALAGGNLIHDLGYLGAGMTSSLEMLLLGDEMAGIARHILKGLEISKETLAMEVIEKAGPGGTFLGENHTLKYFKSAVYYPGLLNRFDYVRWKKEGAESFYDRATRKVREILKSHPPSELPSKAAQEIEAITAKIDNTR
ncbi:MAG: trimethylamine methyltransferase [Spirochaetes bacterium]|nr:MAG: trimethylamine methyltransferase [Spirochaetota bacterium]